MNFIELRAFSKVDPDWAKFIVGKGVKRWMVCLENDGVGVGAGAVTALTTADVAGVADGVCAAAVAVVATKLKRY